MTRQSLDETVEIINQPGEAVSVAGRLGETTRRLPRQSKRKTVDMNDLECVSGGSGAHKGR